MTTEQIEQVRTIAEYDGWLLIPEGTYIECHNQTIWFGHGGKYDCYHDITSIGQMKYLTSLDWLHPCAMKVIDELRQTKAEHRQFYIADIYENCSEKPINSEYIDLFNAVYEGIKFLNEQKQSK